MPFQPFLLPHPLSLSLLGNEPQNSPYRHHALSECIVARAVGTAETHANAQQLCKNVAHHALEGNVDGPGISDSSLPTGLVAGRWHINVPLLPHTRCASRARSGASLVLPMVLVDGRASLRQWQYDDNENTFTHSILSHPKIVDHATHLPFAESIPSHPKVVHHAMHISLAYSIPLHPILATYAMHISCYTFHPLSNPEHLFTKAY